jgi:tetratricopeptide (TPR) repeat protein
MFPKEHQGSGAVNECYNSGQAMTSAKTFSGVILVITLALSLPRGADLGAETQTPDPVKNVAPEVEAVPRVLPGTEANPVITELREAIRLNPNHADAHFALGVELYTTGHVAEGIAELREALRLQPDHADGRYHLAMALMKQRDELTRAEMNRAASSREPVLAETYLDLGKALIALGKFTAAVMELREALRLQPTFVEAHASLGVALFNMGDLENAIEEYRTVLKLQPEAGQAHLNLATALMAQHDWPAARTELQEALRLQPNLVQAQYSLGVVLYTMGDVAGAIDAYRQALHLQSDFAEAHYNLGLMLKLTNQEAEAVQEFHHAALAGLPKAQYFLGAAYASGVGADKNLAAAIRWWFRAAEQEVTQAREGLAQLRRTAVLQAKQSPDEARTILMAFQDYRREIWFEFPDLEGKGSEASAGTALMRQGQWQEAIPVLIREAYGLSEPAHTQLQALYEEGIEGQWPAYDPRILSYFKTTAAEGLLRPRIMLARIYAKGWGVSQDLNKAMSLLKGNQDDEAQRLLKEIAAVQQEPQQATRNTQPASPTVP